MKRFLIFFLFLLKTKIVGTHNLCFRAKIRKNEYPCKPQFYYIKVGCKGVFVTRTCFRDDCQPMEIHRRVFALNKYNKYNSICLIYLMILLVMEEGGGLNKSTDMTKSFFFIFR